MQLKKLTILLVFSALLFSCKKTKDEMLTGEWQAVSQENASLDMMIAQQRNFIDTVGRNTSAAQNIELYQTNNLDSLKAFLSSQVDDFIAQQKKLVENTTFHFREDHVAILNFAGNIDSTKWELNEDGTKLSLDENALKGSGQVIQMGVLELKEDILKLEINRQNFNSTVTFKPVKK